MKGIAVLVSGGGTNLQALIDAQLAGQLPGEIRLVVSSRSDAYALERARRHGIPTATLERRQYGSAIGDYSRDLLQLLTPVQPDLIVLAGFLTVLTEPLLSACQGRIINTHPALIPAFCGPGFYGQRVHEAVLAYGAKLSGATIHFVEQGVDTGPIILQEAVPVLDDDDAASLAARVLPVEHRLLVRAARLHLQERLLIDGRRVRILPEEDC